MTTPAIYDQHRAAFANVAAYVIVKDGRRVATVAFKRGARCTVFVHWIGRTMVRAFAGGSGYDRDSAACSSASEKLETGGDADARAFKDALYRGDSGTGWDVELERAGFQVWNAV